MAMELLKRRIKTTTDLREIVSTMKSLSAVSILQYDEAEKSLIQYRKTILKGLQGLLKRNAIQNLPVRMPSLKNKTLFILIGSDNGLVGKFNRDLVEKSNQYITDAGLNEKDVTYILFGKRLLSLLKGRQIHSHFSLLNSVSVINSTAILVIREVDALLQTHGIKNIVLFHNKRGQGLSLPKVEQTLIYPLTPDFFIKLKQTKWATNKIPFFSISPKKLYSSFIQELLIADVSLALANSLSAEYHTRLINMQAAEKNIDENLEEMTLQYQQARQEAITSELIDIITGASLLKKKDKKKN
ncbi:MAG: F0F1 ATP synthase subunit gamma [Alphaproteobacteria bacterium]|nr:F0F1 ATP synthase subunit gamma [Alphaproteobacteria bacterium]